MTETTPAAIRETSATAVPPARKTLWAWAIATFFGAGLMRPGPGTWGSAAAAMLWFAVGVKLHGARTPLSWITLGAAAAAIAFGVVASTRVEKESGRKDPGHVVIDEVAGQWIALLGSPFTLSHLVAAFLCFRLFDILKPWPVRRFERLPAGWGIVFDDVAAGVYALLVVQMLGTWIGR